MRFIAGFACGVLLMAAIAWTYCRYGFAIDGYVNEQLYPSSFPEGPRVYRLPHGHDGPPIFEGEVPSAKRISID